MIQQLTINPTFKSTTQTQRQVNPQMIRSMSRDEFELMQAQKKEKNKQAWYKAGIIGGCVLAVAFATQAVISVLTHKTNKKIAAATIEAMNSQVKANLAQAKYFSKEKAGNQRTKEQIAKAAEDLYKQFEDLSTNKNIVGIADDSLTPEFKKWADELVSNQGLPKELTEVFGEEAGSNWIYLYGGSGTGKTYDGDVILKALGAKRVKKQFSNFSSKYIGETSVELTKFFEDLACMLEKHPDEKFGVTLDEFETLAKNIENMTKQESHLEQNRTAIINGFDMLKKFKNLYMVASSNVGPKSERIDGAIARRFGRNLEITYPTVQALDASAETHLRRFNIKLDPAERKQFAEELHRRIAGHGDVETVVESAVVKARQAMKDQCIAEGAMKKLENGGYEVINQEKLNEITQRFKDKFDINYLLDALKEKGQTAGEMGNAFTNAV